MITRKDGSTYTPPADMCVTATGVVECGPTPVNFDDLPADWTYVRSIMVDNSVHIVQSPDGRQFLWKPGPEGYLEPDRIYHNYGNEDRGGALLEQNLAYQSGWVNEDEPTTKEILYGGQGYSGDTFDPDSVTRFADLDYYRTKIVEFQMTMNAVDKTQRKLLELRSSLPLVLLEHQEIDALLADYDSRRYQFALAAEAINATSAAANAIGVRMPVLSMPLGLAPVALAAIGAAVAGAAALIAWGVTWIQESHAVTMRISMLELLAPGERAAAVKAALAIEQAQAEQQSPLSALAGSVKWIAAAVALFFAYKAFTDWQKG